MKASAGVLLLAACLLLSSALASHYDELNHNVTAIYQKFRKGWVPARERHCPMPLAAMHATKLWSCRLDQDLHMR